MLLAKHKKGKLSEQYFDNVGTLYGRIVGRLLEETEAAREKSAAKVRKKNEK